jgi:hypothetical protein
MHIILPERQKLTPVFGLACATVSRSTERQQVTAEELVSQRFRDGKLPRIIHDCLDHIRENKTTSGIFRRVPKVAHLELLKEAYERGQPVQLKEWPDSVILASSLLKAYVRSLLHPVIPALFYEDIRKAPLDEAACREWLKESFLPRLESSYPDGQSMLRLLQIVLQLLHEISKQSGASDMYARIHTAKQNQQIPTRWILAIWPSLCLLFSYDQTTPKRML